mmetsp:Transcript_12379/g.28666  ORF Transcript_12379/g.28666 Transcript_12379/m.28666 type:complete len:174 (-) Transcript_12379:1402-1923(-)
MAGGRLPIVLWKSGQGRDGSHALRALFQVLQSQHGAGRAGFQERHLEGIRIRLPPGSYGMCQGPTGTGSNVAILPTDPGQEERLERTRIRQSQEKAETKETMKKATTITTTEIDKKNLQCGDVTCDVSCVFFRLSLEVHGMSTLGLLLLTIGDVDNQYPSKDWRLVSFFCHII